MCWTECNSDLSESKVAICSVYRHAALTVILVPLGKRGTASDIDADLKVMVDL